MLDDLRQLAFKNLLMDTINKQEMVIDIDEQIVCMKEMITDLKAVWKEEVKNATR